MWGRQPCRRPASGAWSRGGDPPGPLPPPSEADHLSDPPGKWVFPLGALGVLESTVPGPSWRGRVLSVEILALRHQVLACLLGHQPDTRPSLLFLLFKILQNEGDRLNQWFPSLAVCGNYEGLGLRCPFQFLLFSPLPFSYIFYFEKFHAYGKVTRMALWRALRTSPVLTLC